MATYNVVDESGVIHSTFELENEDHLDLIQVGGMRKVRADTVPSEDNSDMPCPLMDEVFTPPEHEDDNTEGAELAAVENGTAG